MKLGSITTVKRKNLFKFGHDQVNVLDFGASFGYITIEINDIISLMPCKQIGGLQSDLDHLRVILFYMYSKNFKVQHGRTDVST